MQLDYAKRHLTHTITSLRRLAMLTAAVDDLEQVGELPASPHKQCRLAPGAYGWCTRNAASWHDVRGLQALGAMRYCR